MFADDYPNRPAVDVAIGLRLLSVKDLELVRAQAAEEAIALYDDHKGGVTDEDARADHFNDALLRGAVARAACNPNDASLPYWEAPDLSVQVALTAEGVRHIWDALVRHHIGSGVGYQPAPDDDLAKLARILQRDSALSLLPDGARAEVGKLLAYCLEQLAPLDPGAEEREPEEDEDDDVAVYTARAAPPAP